MQNLEKEVRTLSQEFATKLGFLDLETMKETAYRFKEMLGDDYTKSDVSSAAEIVSPSQEVSNRKSLCFSNFLSSDEDESNKEKKPRKSRKSVCVLPKAVVSSSEEEEEEDSETESNSGNYENDEESEDEEISQMPNARRKKKNILNSSSEEEENEIGNSCERIDVIDREVVFNDNTKKKIKYFSCSEDDEGNDIDLLSKSLRRQTINNKTIESSVHEGIDKEPGSPVEYEYDSEDDSKGSLKDFVVSDEENDSESSDVSDDESDGDNKESENENIIDSEESDFEQPKKCLPIIKTPASKPAQILKEKHFQKFVTPHSQSKRIISEYCTPKSVPGTPAYKREFNRKREQTVSSLFKLFNKTVFEGKLPDDLQITWNKRMTKTAGFCYYSKSLGVRKCRLELSDKVIDSPERIRDTLIHELCHAATWLINGVQASHGPAWKHWAKKANKIHPDLPIISRCHQYEINTKYNYKCNGCGATFGRHSKSIDASKHRCATCGGIPELQGNASSVSATPKTPNPYALFMKENFARVKKNNPGKPHREIMVLIADKFKNSKDDSNKENIS